MKHMFGHYVKYVLYHYNNIFGHDMKYVLNKGPNAQFFYNALGVFQIGIKGYSASKNL